MGLSLAYWWLSAQGKGVAPQVNPSSVRQVAEPAPDKVSLALTGGSAAGASAALAGAAPGVGGGGDSRFRLLGVVAQGAGTGVALMAVDGQAAKPYRSGTLVLEPYYLAKVQAQSVVLRSQGQTSGGVEIKLSPVTGKTSTGASLAILPPPGAGNVLPLQAPGVPAGSSGKNEHGVIGADEAQALASFRSGVSAANAAPGKMADTSAKAGFSDLMKAVGGVSPPMPGGAMAGPPAQ